MGGKKKWRKPKLIVIVRGKRDRQEAVLAGCKGGLLSGYQDYVSICSLSQAGYCNLCTAIAPS